MSFEETNPKRPAKAEQREKQPYEDAFYWLQTLVIAIVCITLVFTFLGRVTRVVGHSMDPTLQDGQMMLVWSLGYQPQPGDIVIANKNTETAAQVLHGDAIVKRVIAVGGQTVDIDYANSQVYVDGQPIEEDYILEEMDWPAWNSQMQQVHWEVPEGSVFLMGDNRNNSADSRHDWVGPVDEDYLLGRAIFSLLPFDRIGPV